MLDVRLAHPSLVVAVVELVWMRWKDGKLHELSIGEFFGQRLQPGFVTYTSSSQTMTWYLIASMTVASLFCLLSVYKAETVGFVFVDSSVWFPRLQTMDCMIYI